LRAVRRAKSDTNCDTNDYVHFHTDTHGNCNTYCCLNCDDYADCDSNAKSYTDSET
jgi:hypothetical protein